MPDRDLPANVDRAPLPRSELTAALHKLGVRPGAVVMVHASMSRLGWVVGGSQTVVEALLEASGPNGTVLAYAGWEDNPYHLAEWPIAWQQAYRAEMPPFDPALAEARHVNGRLPERIRTWPGSHRSAHPEAGFVALGTRAAELTADQDRHLPYGPRSPLGRLVDADGQVLLLGAPFTTMTLLHHVESILDLPGKRTVRYEMPIRRGDAVVWESFTDINSDGAAFPYETLSDGDLGDFVGTVLRKAELGAFGRVGGAPSYLVDARAFVDFAVGWLTSRFG